MCRLALFNRAALHLLGHQPLDLLLQTLECHLGGDGNGIATLWQTTGRINVRKSVHFSAHAAAGELRFAVTQGADWAVFHTRLATSATVCASACHPFRRGSLVLAHNGHDALFARLGASTRTKRSDSAALTDYWYRRHLPLALLANRPGVFLGFAHALPFVVKGQATRDLVLAYQQATDALLFASELPAEIAALFDDVCAVGKLIWQGEPLDLATVERRPLPVKQPPEKIMGLALERGKYPCAE